MLARMSIDPAAPPSNEAARIRSEYEQSLSWRITRPLRLARGAVRRLGTDSATSGVLELSPLESLDSWLQSVYGERLAAIDRACALTSGPERFALFRELDDDVWALLLTRQYTGYPNIATLLPDVPAPELQEMWNGLSGVPLARQSRGFYARLREIYERHGPRSLADSHVLDFGCGWGRLTRMLARDVGPGALYGCDPTQAILDVCAELRVPATLARSEFVPERLPFDRRFDLAYAFSVFTHLSERSHQACLRALHDALEPGGILVVTIRPPAFLYANELIAPAREQLRRDPALLEKATYLFVPHMAIEQHPQYSGGGEIEYGETIITLAYVRERWTELFELLDVRVQLEDPHQVILTLRRPA
jgi:SAM-dependent methyltransferase